MTKLEQKLLELGYEFYLIDNGRVIYIKDYHKIRLTIVMSEKIYGFINTYKIDRIDYQQDIDNLQQAFNQLQNDLEVLKKYEE